MDHYDTPKAQYLRQLSNVTWARENSELPVPTVYLAWYPILEATSSDDAGMLTDALLQAATGGGGDGVTGTYGAQIRDGGGEGRCSRA